MNTGNVFRNAALKKEALDSHNELKKAIDAMVIAATSMKTSVDVGVRTLVSDESVSGQYAKALDAECTEILEDLARYITDLTEKVTLISGKISEIEALDSNYSITPADLVTLEDGKYSRDVITNLNGNREHQSIYISSTEDPLVKKNAKKRTTASITGYEEILLVITEKLT